jgi:flagellar hook-associated protein 3 FlgL
MRVSNALVTQSIIGRLQTSSRLLQEAQLRATSGKKVERLSDDPTAGSAIMQASSGLRGLEQYGRNVDRVKARLDAEDSALGQVTEILTRAKELGIATVGANADGAARTTGAAELRQLILQVVNLGNTKLGDEYLFGGTNSDGARPPFTPPTTLSDGSRVFVTTDPPTAPATVPVPRTPTGQRGVEIAAGQVLYGAHDGARVFLQTGVFKALDDLATAMETDQPAQMGLALHALDAAFAGVQATIGEVGARQNQVDVVRGGIDALTASLAEQKSGLAEVDMEQAITEMLARQTAYQSAMLASSKVMGLSLTDYIR